MSTPDALREMIIEKLVERRERSEIVQAVCEQANIEWAEAEQLVRQVETEQAHAVARGQMPTLVFLSAATAAAGLLVLWYALQSIWDVVVRADLLAFILTAAGGTSVLWVGILGLAMIAGGVVGMWKTWTRYFET